MLASLSPLEIAIQYFVSLASAEMPNMSNSTFWLLGSVAKRRVFKVVFNIGSNYCLYKIKFITTTTTGTIGFSHISCSTVPE